MIDWLIYDPANPPRDGTYLVCDGKHVDVATMGTYCDESDCYPPDISPIHKSDITHFAAINMPASAANRALTLQGTVTEGRYKYQRMTKVEPVPHYYDDDYIKYSCPVCEALGNKHQVSEGRSNCPLCNVNLAWEGLLNG